MTAFTGQENSSCWTCILRQQECDEVRPTCGVCDEVGLSCDGYDERPDWVDHLDQKRRRREVVRDIVRRNLERRGSTRRQDAPQLKPSHGSTPNMSTFKKSTRPNRSASASILPLDDQHFFTAAADLGRTQGIEPTPEFPTFNFESDVSGWNNHGSDLSGGASFSSTGSAFKSNPNDFNLNTDFASLTDVSLLCTEAQLTFPNLGTCTRDSTTLADLSVEEADLFHHYLADACWEQHPHCSRSSPKQRGWLLILILRSRASLFSTLSLSAYHLRLITPIDAELDVWKAHQVSERYYMLALKGLYEHIDMALSPTVSGDIKKRVDVLFSVLQLLYLEASHLFTSKL